MENFIFLSMILPCYFSQLREFLRSLLTGDISSSNHFLYSFLKSFRNSAKPYGCTARLKTNLNSRMVCATSIHEKLMLLQERSKREKRVQETGEKAGK